MKRLFDVALTLLLMPLWAPLALVTALAVRAYLGSPVLFVQKRAGKGGKVFSLVKFRTMSQGSGDDASRLGRFGLFLRSTSLDEIPQFWNVLKGDMSLVGPRPLPAEYLPRYSPVQNRRHEVKPGITGWAQVHGRNDLEWEEKFLYDVEYVDSHSFALDLKILAMTLLKVVQRRGISHGAEKTMSEFTGGGALNAPRNRVP